jgi:RecA/RadA recombinase
MSMLPLKELIGELVGITTLYGPAGSGKTTICYAASKGRRKVVWIDADLAFNASRFNQISDIKTVSIARPMSVASQLTSLNRIRDMISELGPDCLVVVDSITVFFRGSQKPELMKDLAAHLSILKDISKKVPIIMTAQVYTDYRDSRVKMVGGDVLSYMSDCIVELTRDKVRNQRKMKVTRHRKVEIGKSILFKITAEGIE